MSNAAFLRDETIRIAAMISMARRMLEAGASVDLTPIGLGIDTLCKAVTRLPATEGIKLKDDLDGLTGRLERLGNDIEARYQSVVNPQKALVTPAAKG